MSFSVLLSFIDIGSVGSQNGTIGKAQIYNIQIRCFDIFVGEKAERRFKQFGIIRDFLVFLISDTGDSRIGNALIRVPAISRCITILFEVFIVLVGSSTGE